MQVSDCSCKEIVTRDFVVCFLVSFDSYEVPTHSELVHLHFKFRFCVKYFNFRVSAYEVYSVSERLSAAIIVAPNSKNLA
jgi:hypothetical protein